MTASLSVITAAGSTAPACVHDSSSLCARVWDVTGQAWLAGNAEALVATPARILLVVDLGEAVGTVEAVGLRITRLRDAHGVVWYARNGEILRVGNKSQGFAQVVLDMPVAHETDLEHCRTVMQDVADAMYGEAEWS